MNDRRIEQHPMRYVYLTIYVVIMFLIHIYLQRKYNLYIKVKNVRYLEPSNISHNNLVQVVSGVTYKPFEYPFLDNFIVM